MFVASVDLIDNQLVAPNVVKSSGLKSHKLTNVSGVVSTTLPSTLHGFYTTPVSPFEPWLTRMQAKTGSSVVGHLLTHCDSS